MHPLAAELVESLANKLSTLAPADLRKAQTEIAYLREQLNRRKGGGNPESSKGSSELASRSSEKERAESSEKSPHTKHTKLDRIRIDREEGLRLDPAGLPADNGLSTLAPAESRATKT